MGVLWIFERQPYLYLGLATKYATIKLRYAKIGTAPTLSSPERVDLKGYNPDCRAAAVHPYLPIGRILRNMQATRLMKLGVTGNDLVEWRKNWWPPSNAFCLSVEPTICRQISYLRVRRQRPEKSSSPFHAPRRLTHTTMSSTCDVCGAQPSKYKCPNCTVK